MKRKEKGWKKAVVLMLALIMCISSIVVPQPEEVSAKAANRIDFKINGKAGSKVTLYAGEYVKFTIDGMWQNGDYIQTSGTNAYGDKINFKPSKELTYKSVSYTHLDVYKRQCLHCMCFCRHGMNTNYGRW